MRFLSQKGAMFGLDARITLAIFSGLSVVAGAVGYGYMSKTQVTAVVTELTNVSKAYINFQLDTQVDTETFTDLLDRDGGQIGWNGPYLTMSSDDHLAYGKYNLLYGIDMNKVKGSKPRPCLNKKDLCFVWVQLTDVPSKLALQVDEAVDGSNGGEGTPDSGNLLVNNDLSTDRAVISYKLTRK